MKRNFTSLLLMLVLGSAGAWATVPTDNGDENTPSYNIPSEDLADVTQRMNAEVRKAFNEALEAYNNNKTKETYNALNEANDAAKASISAYASASKNMAMAIDVLKTNVCNEDAKARVQEKVDKYLAETLSDNEATELSGDNFLNDVKAVLMYCWSADGNIQIIPNFFSTEIYTLDPDFSIPFIEAYNTDGDGALKNSKISTSITGVESGSYRVTADVCLYQKDAATAPMGVTLQVGGGTPVLFERNAIPYGDYYVAHMTATGVVGANLDITLAVNNTEATRLFLKNVKYEKIGEEMVYLEVLQKCNYFKSFYNTNTSYKVDDNTTIYKVSNIYSSTIKLTRVQDIDGKSEKIIPANTPVILRKYGADDLSTIHLTATDEMPAAEIEYDDNMLNVATVNGVVDNAYVLGYLDPSSVDDGSDAGFGFYRFSAALEKGQIYVAMSNGAKKLTLDFDDDSTTAITDVKAADGSVTDGKFLKDGKFVIVKNGKQYNAAGQEMK